MTERIGMGVFAGIDRHFAEFIRRFSAVDPEAVFWAAALLSRVTATGNVCLDLNAWAGRPLPGSKVDLTCPAADRWTAALRSCPAVGRPGERRPLVLDDRNRLYLYRYWEYEHRLAAGLSDRAGTPPEHLDLEKWQAALQRQCPAGNAAGIDWQQVAVAVSLARRLAVIIGGPGTGKTTTVARILAVWEDVHAGRPTRVALAAPTGKAAARLQESLQTRSEGAFAPGSRGHAASYEVHTLHRLLRPVPGTPLFQFNAAHPLPVDLVIVDEVSMVDLALMAKLMDALPAEARLVLIGDRDQLASVEAGSVLGDICGGDRRPGFSPPFADLIRRVSGQPVPLAPGSRPLQDSIVELQTHYRFDSAGAIGALSRAVNQGDVARTLDVLSGTGDGSIRWQEPLPGHKGLAEVERRLSAGYAAYPPEGGPVRILEELGRFKVLCAHRGGPYGVAAVNRRVERMLMRQNRIRVDLRRGSAWYSGRPILITQNDYRLRLFNGDLGVALSGSAERSEGVTVFFTGADGALRRFLPYHLPEHETVFAMTVHKSQGSEFEEVLLILPEEDSPVLSRELIYTALTRARKRFTLLGRREMIAAAVTRRIERASGLQAALWG